MTARRTVRRSVELWSCFRSWQDDPDRFYGAIASDAARLVGARVGLAGSLVLDVGGGAGYFAAAFRDAGATCFVAEPDASELSWRGRRPDGAVLADGCTLPFRTEAVDLVVSSNVLEHVATPYAMLDELARITRRGGYVWVSFTNWYSPWGGHEVSPWHYLGARRAERRFELRRGHPPKNVLGASLFKIHVGGTLRYLAEHPVLEVVDAVPRYLPDPFRCVLRVPGLREVVTWNLELLLRHRPAGEARPADPGAVEVGNL